jgi:predicted DNA-binding transcriptional regulator AlpA
VSAGALIRFPVERRQPRRLVSLGELIDAFGMSERWWRYRVAEGMPVHRFGRRALRFDLAEVEQWMEAHSAA